MVRACVRVCTRAFRAVVSGVLFGMSLGFCNYSGCLYEQLCERERFKLFCVNESHRHIN